MESLNQYLQVQRDENEILKNEVIEQLKELFFPLQHTMTILGGISARHSNFISELCQYEQKINRKLTEIKFELKKFRIQNKYPKYNPPAAVSPCSDDYLDDIKTLKENSSKLILKLNKLCDTSFEEPENKVVSFHDINNELKLCTRDESQGSDWLKSFESNISQKKDMVSLESLESLERFMRLEEKIRVSQEKEYENHNISSHKDTFLLHQFEQSKDNDKFAQELFQSEQSVEKPVTYLQELIDPEQLSVSAELSISKVNKSPYESVELKQSISPENSFSQEPNESTHSSEKSASFELSISEEKPLSSKKQVLSIKSVNLNQNVSGENDIFSEESNEFDMPVRKSVGLEENNEKISPEKSVHFVQSISVKKKTISQEAVCAQEQVESVENSVSVKQYNIIESVEKFVSLQQSFSGEKQTFSQETVESAKKSVDLEQKEGVDSFSQEAFSSIQSVEESVNPEENISVENFTPLELEKSVSLEQSISEGVGSFSQEAYSSIESVKNSVNSEENISVENLTPVELEKSVNLEQNISEAVDSLSQEVFCSIQSVKKSVDLEENISVEKLSPLKPENSVGLQQDISEGVDLFSQDTVGSLKSLEESVNLEENISVEKLTALDPEKSVKMEQSISEGVDSFTQEAVGSIQSVEKSVNLEENISVEPEESVSSKRSISSERDTRSQKLVVCIESVEQCKDSEHSETPDLCSDSTKLEEINNVCTIESIAVNEKYDQVVISKYTYQECMESSFSETDYEEQEDEESTQEQENSGVKDAASESRPSSQNSSVFVELEKDQTNPEFVQKETENLECEHDEIQNNKSVHFEEKDTDLELDPNEMQDSKSEQSKYDCASFESKNVDDLNSTCSSNSGLHDKSIEVIEIRSSNDEMARGQSFQVCRSNSNVSILTVSECDSGVLADSTHEVEEDCSTNVRKIERNLLSQSTVERTANRNVSSGKEISAKKVWWKYNGSSDEAKSPARTATNVNKKNRPVFSAEEKIKKLGLEDRRTLFERTRKMAILPDLRLRAAELPATDSEKLRWKKNKENGKYEIMNPEPLTEGMVCVFSHVESPVEFYLHPNVEEAKLIDCLNEMMTEYYIKTPPIYHSKIDAKSDIEKFCCAFVKEDKMYYRVEIFDWLLEKSEKVLAVQLVDYGNYQIVHFKHLRRLTLQFSSLPKLAVRCYFPLLYPPGSKRNQLLCTWPKSSIDALFELSGLSLQKGRFFFRIVYAERERNITAVDMYQIIGPDPNTLGQILIDLGHAVQIILPGDDPLGILNDEEDIKNLEKCENLNEVILGYDPKDEARICKFTKKNGGKCFKRSCKLQHVPFCRDGFTTDQTLTYTEAFYDMKPLKPKEFTAIRFTTLIDATRFYGNVIYYVEDLRRLEIKMNDPYNTCKFEKFKILPAHGEIVLVHHWQKRWLRAKVRHHVFNDDGVCVGVQVFMVDYGDIIDIRLELIRKIKMEYLYLPFQVIECEISNYEASPSYDREKMDKFFYEKMVFRNFSAKVVAVSDMQVCLEVYFKDRKLGDILAEYGFLQKETQPKKIYPHENSLLIPG